MTASHVPAQSNEHPIDIKMNKALKEDAVTAWDVISVYMQAEQEWEAEMNRNLQAINEMAGKDEAKQKKLQEAQKAWLAFKTDEMEFNAAYWGLFQGSMYQTYSPYYGMFIVRLRALELFYYFDKNTNYSRSAFDDNDAYKTEEEWDKLLNANYQALMKKLARAEQDKLRAAQRKWIPYRDAEAAAYDLCSRTANPDYKALLVRERALRLGKYWGDIMLNE